MRTKLDIAALLSLGLFSLLIILQVLYIILVKDFKFFFGVEYGNIATSIMEGDGFSNPFYSKTGPTAWMPPLLVYLIAFSYFIFGKSLAAFIFLSILKFASISLTLYLIFKVIDLTGIKKYYTLVVFIYLFYFLLNLSGTFTDIHDYWLTNLLVIVFLYSLIRFLLKKSKNNILLYFVIFLIPLTNPSYGLGFLTVIGIFLVIIPLMESVKNKNLFNKNSTFNKPFLKALSFAVVFLLAISIWSVRNYKVFNEFIPLKSNMWFEFYLSNIIDSDGQLSRSTVYKEHPLYHKSLRDDILAEGEYNWMEKYKTESFDYFNNNTSDYFKKIKFRIFNAFVFMENDMDIVNSRLLPSLNENDKLILAGNKLIHGDKWNSIYLEDEVFLKKLEELRISDKTLIFDDWKQAKNHYQRIKYSIPNIARGLIISLVPTLILIVFLFIERFRKNKLILSILIIYLVYLSPYLIISHQIRYQRPLNILQILLLSIFLSYLLKLVTPYFNFLQRVK